MKRLVLAAALLLAGLVAPARAQERAVTVAVSDTYMKDGLEQLAREYEQLHPGVRVNINMQPGMGYATWIRAAIAGGDRAPDIFNGNYGNSFYEAGLLANLTPYLDSTSPYTGKRWRDSFYREYIDAFKVGADYVMIPLTYIEIGVYYNKDLFRRVGVEPPGTWAEYMELCGQLRAAGHIPVAVPANMDSYWQGTVGWMARFFTDAYFFDRAPLVVPKPGDYLFDPARDGQYVHDPSDPFATGKVNKGKERQLQAILDGDIAFDGPENREIWTRIREFSAHWQRGFHGTSDASANRLFLTGEAAMMMNTSAFMFYLERQLGEMSPQDRFDWGVFRVPPVTDSELPVIPFRGVGGPLPVWGVIQKSREQTDLVADLMMFLTTPRAARVYLDTAMASQQGILGPFVIRDVPLEPELQARFEPFLGLGREYMTFRGLEDEQYSSWMFSVLAQDYMAGARPLDEFLELYQRAMIEAIATIVKTNDLDMDPATRDNNEPFIAEVRASILELAREPSAGGAEGFVEALRARLALDARRPVLLDEPEGVQLLVDKTLPIAVVPSEAAFDSMSARAAGLANENGWQYLAVVLVGKAPRCEVHRFRPSTDEVLRGLSGRRYSSEELRELWLIK